MFNTVHRYWEDCSDSRQTMQCRSWSGLPPSAAPLPQSKSNCSANFPPAPLPRISPFFLSFSPFFPVRVRLLDLSCRVQTCTAGGKGREASEFVQRIEVQDRHYPAYFLFLLSFICLFFGDATLMGSGIGIT